MIRNIIEKIKIIIWVIFYLIKNKGQFRIDMQKQSFNDNYWIDKYDDDFYIKTSFWDIIEDIYFCN